MEQGKLAQSKPPYFLKLRLGDRRKYPRFSCELPIDCITTESKTHVGIAANVSQGGLLICLHERITVGTPLRVQLVFAEDFQLKAIGANAVVIWTHVAPHALWGRHQYGLRLTGMSERVFSDFQALLGQLARQSHLNEGIPSS
jgi:hypothetical protein